MAVPAAAPARVLLLALLAACDGMVVPYYRDPRIHSMGNGRLHAELAPAATRLINAVSYGGRDVRREILDHHVRGTGTVVDLACGVGMSTSDGALGIDTSEDMIACARRRNGANASFEVGNAETWGEPLSYDVVTVFFALHEMPSCARRAVLRNAFRLAKKRVVVADIAPEKVPSRLMLAGEPFLVEYQHSIRSELAALTSHPSVRTARTVDLLPGHVLLCVIDLIRDPRARPLGRSS
tara:strand:- start:3833 stop:4546 length:714 start_codon:yes stop_codon:yes gene_type:complete